jgi:carbohydrate kinase (thermoresistant glucokinase family)
MSDSDREVAAGSVDAFRGSTAEVVERLGCEIVGGRKRRGLHLTVEAVVDEFGVTRPMAREVLQILHQKGLVNLQPRIGATVQALGDWDLLDREVITWRLEEAPDSQMRSLTQLREMIEPWAARTAATWRPAEICLDLVGLSHRLRDLSLDPDFDEPERGFDIREDFRDVDALFHQTLLLGSRNELLLPLAYPVKKALDHRIDRDWAGLHPESAVMPAFADAALGTVKPYPLRPQPIAMWFHIGLAHAVDQGLPTAAGAFAEAILAEMQHGRLKDPAVRSRLREGLSQLNIKGLRAEDRDPFRKAIHEIVQRRHIPVVVMGVTGSGKTTIGKLLAASLGTPYEEGDVFHPPQNLIQMTQGIPLDDRSRSPWLAGIARRIAVTDPDDGLVITCSALKRIYREVLRAANPHTLFVHLTIEPGDAAARVASRDSHFMPASLVTSQFDTLEPLEPDETGLTLDATIPPLQIVSTIQTHLAHLRMTTQAA